MMPVQKRRPQPGAVALVGSGEYLPAMREIDTYLLNTVGGVQSARVALLPTASGLELMGPTSWNDAGLQHFKQLGVSDVRATRIIKPDSANDPAQVALLEDADLFYFSGGNPHYAVDTLYDSRAWKQIQAAHEQGAVLAGCSAGAMMLGGGMLPTSRAMRGKRVECVAALGLVPYLIVLPHFDRLTSPLNQERLLQLLHAAPPGYIGVGIDEDTAFIRIETNVGGSEQDRWYVMGRQRVHIFEGSVLQRVLQSGEEVLL